MNAEALGYAHLLEIDEAERAINVYRVYSDGKKQLFTSMELPENCLEDNRENFKAFALRLGENILVDSPSARRLLGV